MAYTHQTNLQLVYTDARLDSIFQVLDDLHTAASEGRMGRLTPLTHEEMVGWLRDLVYTAEETIAEIEKGSPASSGPRLRLVK